MGIALPTVLRLLTVAGVAIVAACTIQLRGGQDVPSPSPAAQKADALDMKLTRCRTVTPEQAEDFAQCRRVWAENRRHFLGKDPSRAPSEEQER